MDVRAELYRKLNAKELMPLNCGIGEDSARRANSPSYRKSVLVFIARTDVEAETPILWPLDAKS